MLKRRQKENFDRRHGARTLPTLSPGDKVWVPDQEAEGRVIEETVYCFIVYPVGETWCNVYACVLGPRSLYICVYVCSTVSSMNYWLHYTHSLVYTFISS